MLTDNDKKELAYKICSEVFEGKIDNIEKLDKAWPHELKGHKLYNEIFGNITEYFVNSDIHKGKVDEGSWEFLNFYTAYKVLEYTKDIGELYAAYKDTLKIKNLTKERVEENLKKLLKEKLQTF